MDEVADFWISVLLPIGSVRPWLVDCLESINVASKDLNVELVVVLNNLDTVERKWVISQIERAWKGEVRMFVDNSKNLSDVLNTGIRGAKGKFIARIDDDDLMEPDRLSVQAGYLISFPKTVLIGGSVKVIDSTGEQIRLNTFPSLNAQIKQSLKYGNCFAHTAVMFSRFDAIRAGMYDKQYPFAEDYHLWTKLAQIGEVHNTEGLAASYRIHKSQLNRIQKARQIASVKQIIREVAFINFLDTHVLKTISCSDGLVKTKKQMRSNGTRILSRQYFAIARLFADDLRKFNRKSFRYLLVSLVINPIEFKRNVESMLAFRYQTKISNK